MALRDFILNNLKWKLSALTFAMFVWYGIQVILNKGIQPNELPIVNYRNYTFPRQPIVVVTNPDDARSFRITPAKVDVVIRSTDSALNKLTETDIKVFVNLIDLAEGLEEAKEVFVYVPEGVVVYDIRVDPAAVKVERVIQASLSGNSNEQ